MLAISCKRPAPTRLIPFSYFWICWKLTPKWRPNAFLRKPHHPSSATDFFAYRNIINMWIFHLAFPSTGCERPRIGIPGVKSTEFSQPFAFSAGKHLDIAKAPGIPGHPQRGVDCYLYTELRAFNPSWSLRRRPKSSH